MSFDLREDWPVALVAVLLLGGCGIWIWFSLTLNCVRSHDEQRMQCDTIQISNGYSTANCYPYTATVCDEWARK